MRKIEFSLGTIGTTITVMVLLALGFVSGRKSVNVAKYCQTQTK